MPCYDPRDADDDRTNREFILKVGPLMCEAVELLSANGLLGYGSVALQDWAKKHFERDAERKKLLNR